MRIVIILIAWRKARNVLALGSPDLCPQLRLRPASMTANFDDAVKPRKTPLPHLNVACNSPTTLSNFESTSLKFRGFSTSPICLTTELHAKLVGSFRGPQSLARQCSREAFYSPGSTTVASTPRTGTSSSRQRFTGSHELLSTFLKSFDPHMGEVDGYTNCDGLRTHATTVCRRQLCFAIAWFLMRAILLADRLIERFGRDKL